MSFSRDMPDNGPKRRSVSSLKASSGCTADVGVVSWRVFVKSVQELMVFSRNSLLLLLLRDSDVMSFINLID